MTKCKYYQQNEALYSVNNQPRNNTHRYKWTRETLHKTKYSRSTELTRIPLKGRNLRLEKKTLISSPTPQPQTSCLSNTHCVRQISPALRDVRRDLETRNLLKESCFCWVVKPSVGSTLGERLSYIKLWDTSNTVLYSQFDVIKKSYIDLIYIYIYIYIHQVWHRFAAFGR